MGVKWTYRTTITEKIVSNSTSNQLVGGSSPSGGTQKDGRKGKAFSPDFAKSGENALPLHNTSVCSSTSSVADLPGSGG